MLNQFTELVEKILDKLVLLLPPWATPNFLTTLRLFLAAAAGLALVEEREVVALFLFLLAALTDALDGKVARVRNQITDWGKIYDPLVDKIVNLGLLWFFALQVEGWFLVLLGLETALNVILAAGGLRLWLIGIRTGANRFGKRKMVLEVLVIICLFLGWLPAANVLLLLALAFAIGSLAGYWKNVPKKEYANVFTATNFTLGLTAVFLAVSKIFGLAVSEIIGILIYAAMIADVLDGPLARKWGASSPLGTKFDSLADLISFGLAPMLLLLSIILSSSMTNWLMVIYILIAICYAFFMKLRLDRYLKEADWRQHSQYFKGLPSPAAAGVIVPLILISSRYQIPLWLLLLTTLGLAALMLSTYPYEHAGSRLLKKFILPLSITVIFASHYHFLNELVFAIFAAYLLSPFLKSEKVKRVLSKK